MAITGGIKFFDRSKTLADDGTIAVASSGTAAVVRALDKNRFTKWRSVGSADTITETFDITLPAATTIDRLFFIGHNWKEFTVKYDLAGVPTDFTTVIGLDGALGGGISETAFADNTAYYEFDAVSVTTLNITITKTQVADAEKTVNQIIATTELATLVGFPQIKPLRHSRNTKIKKAPSGRVSTQKSEEYLRALQIRYKTYPAKLTSDLDLAFTLNDREDDFLVWLSGGRRGAPFFNYELKGFRLEDVFPMQIIKDIQVGYAKGIFSNAVDIRLDMAEAI